MSGVSTHLVGEGEIGWTTLQTVSPDTGLASSVHWVPVEQFIHTLTVDATCICGPHVVYIEHPQTGIGLVPMIRHAPLDATYYDEDDDDWDDGDELPDPT